MTPSPRVKPAINQWHRYAGITAAGLLVFLLATGVPLQFGAELDLGKTYVSSHWILDWYGFSAPGEVVGSGPIVQVDDQLYWQSQFIGSSQSLIGSVTHRDFLIIATRHEVLIFHAQTREVLDRSYLDATLNQIGQLDDRIYMDTSQGLRVGDPNLTNWTTTIQAADAITWAAVKPLSASESEPFRTAYRSRLLSIERWLQDLHSGRFFGTIGIIVLDIASALLLILAVTGLIIWWRSRRI
ncbi:MAG: PepSY-associated TM helix domain-containing protein [Gammaproteobacteria bacterium]|nr:PepSY-associated TM helix domain-containing protein [Gammaproteobacteria bacterium]